MKKKFTEEEKKMAIDLYQSGLGYKKISKIVGCYPSTIKKWVEKLDLDKNQWPKHDDNIKQKVLDYYRNNESTISDVSYIFSIPKSTIEKWICKAGIYKEKKKYDRNQIIEDIKTMSGSDVAKKHGCSESLISLIKNGKL